MLKALNEKRKRKKRWVVGRSGSIVIIIKNKIKKNKMTWSPGFTNHRYNSVH